MTMSRSAIVGAFVLGGLLLFGAGLFLIGDRRMLFSEQFEVVSTFGRVSGLEIGTQVRVAGLVAGEVIEIDVPSAPSRPFRVRMRLREDLHHLVRTDSVCAVQTDGLVGNAFVQVSRGTDEAPVVTPGQTLAGLDMIEFSDLIQEGRDTFRTVTTEVMELKDDVSLAILAATDATRTVDKVLSETGTEIQAMMRTSTTAVDKLQGMLTDAQVMVARVRAGEGSIGRLVTDDALYERVKGIAAETEQTMANLQAVTERARVTFDDVTARGGSARSMLRRVEGTLSEAEQAMANVADNTEALKRNILFRGFFRDRGFYSLDEMTRDSYVGGALEGDGRVALRVWIAADGLFARDADGIEYLTEAGRQRLDSTMADLVRYPRDSPLMVEGYATPTAGVAPHVLAADRATLVRDYLTGRYRRGASTTGVMPMGARAPDSPGGTGEWSGVALALFVKNAALADPPADLPATSTLSSSSR